MSVQHLRTTDLFFSLFLGTNLVKIDLMVGSFGSDIPRRRLKM